MPIHHAITKKADKLGFTIEERADLFVLVDEEGATTNPPVDSKGISAMLAAIDKNPDDHGIEFEHDLGDPTDEDDDNSIAKCGVMDASAHARYESNPHGPGCNDSVDCALRDAYTSESNGLDREGIKACAGQLWDVKYETLNNGMVRMNVANKIRGFLRNHDDAVVTIGAETGRFGVSYNPAKRKARKAKV